MVVDLDGLLNDEQNIDKMDVELLIHVVEAFPNLAGKASLNGRSRNHHL